METNVNKLFYDNFISNDITSLTKKQTYENVMTLSHDVTMQKVCKFL